MHIVVFNGSPHPEGNTARLLDEAGQVLNGHGITCRAVHIGGMAMSACKSCGACATDKGRGNCAQNHDSFNALVECLRQADGAIFGTPTHCWGMPSPMQAFVERLYQVCLHDQMDGPLMRKVVAPVISEQYNGGEVVYYQLMSLFAVASAVMHTSSYWNIGIADRRGNMDKDQQGLATVKTLGSNMAWLLHKLCPENGEGK